MIAGVTAARAALIYADARSGIDARLWRAALGTPGAVTDRPAATAGHTALGLQSLLAIIGEAPPPAAPHGAGRPDDRASPPRATAHAEAIAAAAQRTGIPASALAAIIGAEAAPAPGGGWLAASRNRRSSAAGLGQFLSGTWLSEAGRAGTWLNQAALAHGWLGADGSVLPAARAALLALRDDPRAAIEATADYAGHSLKALARAGVAVGQGVEAIAQAAYLGHNLGAGDAVRFLGAGLGETRARQLLSAQIGAAAADRRITAAGGAEAAHRSWLRDFIGNHIRPGRTTA